MKPFNLERALAGDQVIAVSGNTERKVFDVRHFPHASEDCRVYAVLEGNPNPDRFYEDGTAEWNSAIKLMMAPQTKKLWIAIKNGKASYRETSIAFVKLEDLKNNCYLGDMADYQIVEVEIEE